MTEPAGVETPEEDVPQKPCPMCAGSGKVRDYVFNVSTSVAAGAATSYMIDMNNLQPWMISTPICGT